MSSVTDGGWRIRIQFTGTCDDCGKRLQATGTVPSGQMNGMTSQTARVRCARCGTISECAREDLGPVPPRDRGDGA